MQFGVIGLGRFGRAFIELTRHHGHTARGFDTAVATGDDLQTVVAEAQVVVFAVPVANLRAALESCVPLLRPEQLVLDVGSTKVLPERDLRSVLGNRIPWVATHPLFGPVSLSRGEPQQVVICPRPDAPDLTAKAVDVYRGIGCTTVEVSAEEHDRVMSRTHVLAFFVAKALQHIGAASAPFAPPSFQSMARVVDLVREDAGHLFEAIQTSNPFAKDAREALMSAMAAIHQDLP